jgi:hypothetical protein
MLSLVAFNLVRDVMCQQFQTEPLRREPDAPKLRWHMSFVGWTRPMAAVLRAAADALDGFEQPGLVAQN